MFKQDEKKKFIIIAGVLAVILVAVLLKLHFSLQTIKKSLSGTPEQGWFSDLGKHELMEGSIFSENRNAKSSPTCHKRGTYHVISKFDLMPAAASRTIPAIVHISLNSKSPYKLQHQKFGLNIYKPLRKSYQSLGSGVIVSPDGYIITNNHVIENLAGKIRIEIPGNKSYLAKLVGRDPKTDLAVIKVDAKNLPYMQFGDSSGVRIGDVVLAVGNPFGIGESVTMGIISATGRTNIGIVDYEDFIQTDAAVNPGNSGGALVNVRGELIGINTAILTKSGGYEGISFAIPSNMALRIYNEILKKGKVERGWIGIAVQNTLPVNSGYSWSSTYKGLTVVDVVAGGPASIAGLEKNDVLISANGISLRDRIHLQNIVATSGLNESISLRVLRNEKFLDIPVNITKLPDNINIFNIRQ